MEEEGEVGAYGGVYQNCLIEVLVATGGTFKGGDGSHGRLLEHAKGVALSNEFINISAAEGAFKKEHDVLDHVFVGDEIQKSGEGLNGLGSKVLEFGDELVQRNKTC